MQRDRPRFVGRQSDLKDLNAFLKAVGQAPAVAIVNGPPGVGKTALAWEAATTATREAIFTTALFADLHGYDQAATDKTPAHEMYGPLLQGLGIAPELIPNHSGDRATLYHHTLERHAARGEAVLIWLDNVGDRGQIDGLLPFHPVHRIIVTSRETLPHRPNQCVFNLDLLPIDDAVELLGAAIGDPDDARIQADPHAARQLARLCDRLPLALQVMAALVLDEPERPLRRFAEDLEGETHRLDNLDFDDRLSVRAALTLSNKRLPVDLQRLFRLMSQVPGGDVNLDTACYLIDALETQVRSQLRALVRSHLVKQNPAERWSMHDLIRLFATEMAETDRNDADRALTTVVARYWNGVAVVNDLLAGIPSDRSRQQFPTPVHAAVWFEFERKTAISILKHIVDRDGYEAICLHFGVTLGILLRSRPEWESEFHDVAALTASAVSRVPPERISASALDVYGTSLSLQLRHDEARTVFDEAVAMYESMGYVDQASGTRTNIANSLQAEGRYDDAISLYREELRRCPPETHPYAAARTLNNLGAVLNEVGRGPEGVTQILKAVVLSRRADNLFGLAKSLSNLAGTYVSLSEIYRANRQRYLAKAVLTNAPRVLSDQKVPFRQSGSGRHCARFRCRIVLTASIRARDRLPRVGADVLRGLRAAPKCQPRSRAPQERQPWSQ